MDKKETQEDTSQNRQTTFSSKNIKVIIVTNKTDPTKTATYKSIMNNLGEFNMLGFSQTPGFGAARNYGAKLCGSSGLMVQFNDDLVLYPHLFSWLRTIQRGEFALQIVGSNVCSRVFALHVSDYWRVGGCDSRIKYYFEDGDFYIRALKAGLKFRKVPDMFVHHIPHQHALYNPVKNIYVSVEVARLYHKFGRNLRVSIFRFFVPFRDYRVVLQHFMLRCIFLCYYIIKGIN